MEKGGAKKEEKVYAAVRGSDTWMFVFTREGAAEYVSEHTPGKNAVGGIFKVAFRARYA